MGRVIVLATPVFLALIALEVAWGRLRGRQTYSLADAVSSIGLGIMSQYGAVFTRLLRVGIYAAALASLSLVPADAARAFWTGPAGWLLALVFYDLCYYWHHRLGHEVAILWAAHVVHHQSTRYNLSTALRQTSSGALLGWVFYLPMAIAGVPLEVFATVALVDLLYQFWVHTEHVGRLGAFDRWFVSPSNHRVHHAVQDEYLDRNYGGILVVWDRLFGTFAEERAACVYGTRKPLASLDPLWSNAEVYASILFDAWHARRWRDRLRVFVARPGWRPADVAARFPSPPCDPTRSARFAPTASRAATVLGVAAFALALGATAAFLWHADTLPARVSLVAAAGLTALLWIASALLQGRMPTALGAAGVAAVGATAGAALAREGLGGIDWRLLGLACKPLVLGVAAAWAWARWRAGTRAERLQAASWRAAPQGAAAAHPWLLAALLASLAGDVALMLPRGFVPGLAAFLVAHLAYLRVFTIGTRPMPSRGALAATAAFGLAILATLWPHLPAGLHAPVAAYMCAICAMGAQATGRALQRRDRASAAVAAGAVLFMLSDTLLALDRFVAPLPLAPLAILGSYFAAQLLIARFAVDQGGPITAMPTSASRVTSDASASSSQPSVPGGRIGSTR